MGTTSAIPHGGSSGKLASQAQAEQKKRRLCCEYIKKEMKQEGGAFVLSGSSTREDVVGRSKGSMIELFIANSKTLSQWRYLVSFRRVDSHRGCLLKPDLP